MAFYDTTWYCNAGDQSTTGYYAVAKRPQNTAVSAGQLVRQFTAPAVGSERVFVCIVAGTTANTTDATWTTTRGAKTTDGTATWQECTGASAVNGDLTNTATWATAKATGTPTLGAIIKRNNGASYQICSTAGTLGASEPSFSDTAGTTTTEGTTTWTSLGPVANFTGGQAPHARLANACATSWFASGNTIYIGDNHAESQATSITITPTTSLTAVMANLICHDSTKYPPTSPSDLRATASVTTTGSGSINFNPSTGSFYVYGITFSGGSGANASTVVMTATNAYIYFDACVIKKASTIANAIQLSGSNASVIIFNNTQVSFASTGDYIDPGMATFIWQNTGQVLAAGSSVPANFIGAVANGRLNDITLEGLDLSQLTGQINKQNNPVQMGSWLIKDCKLNASLSVLAIAAPGQTIQFVRCNSAAVAYTSERYQFEGAETTEVSITRVGGAVDPNSQAQSRKIATTANAQWLRSFRAEPYAIWNPTTGANVTVTVYGTINAGAVPNNDDIWLEVEYLGSSATPLGTIVNTTKSNILATNAAVSSDSSSWNGGGSGAGWSPFKLTTTLSSPQPAMAGYLQARVRAAKPSTTYYIDPKIELT